MNSVVHDESRETGMIEKEEDYLGWSEINQHH
jgi:hypothetical protein